MWIIGQDGSFALNADNLENLSVDVNKENGKWSVTALAIFGDDQAYILGDYDTEEKATAVMNQILTALGHEFDTYRLPEDITLEG